VLLGILGTMLFYIVEVIERLICPWHVSHRARRRGVEGAR
jgi:NitT/TauT family transport system permease protein